MDPSFLAADSRRNALTFFPGDTPPRYAMADRHRPGKNMHAFQVYVFDLIAKRSILLSPQACRVEALYEAWSRRQKSVSVRVGRANEVSGRLIHNHERF